MSIKRGGILFVISTLAIYSILITKELFKEVDESLEKENFYKGYIDGSKARSLEVYEETMKYAKQNMTEEQYDKFLLDCESIFNKNKKD